MIDIWPTFCYTLTCSPFSWTSLQALASNSHHFALPCGKTAKPKYKVEQILLSVVICFYLYTGQLLMDMNSQCTVASNENSCSICHFLLHILELMPHGHYNTCSCEGWQQPLQQISVQCTDPGFSNMIRQCIIHHLPFDCQATTALLIS